MGNLQLISLVVQVIVAALMIIFILIQKSDGDSLSGIGGNSGNLNPVISSKSSATILSRVTMILIGIFMLNGLLLSSLSSSENRKIKKDLEKIIEQQEKSVPAVPLVK